MRRDFLKYLGFETHKILKMTNPNDPAFVRRAETEYQTATSGITKLEYFAGIAMQGLLVRNVSITSRKLVESSVIIAKELIEEINKQ